MSDLLTDFETFFTTAGLITAGAFFKDTILDDPSSAVAIYEYVGNTPLPQIAGVTRSIQIVTRDDDALAAKVKANELYNALKSPEDEGVVNLTAERWCMLFLLQPPFKFKVDTRGRSLYCFNVSVTTFND